MAGLMNLSSFIGQPMVIISPPGGIRWTKLANAHAGAQHWPTYIGCRSRPEGTHDLFKPLN